jgi:hypothetical protein
MAMDPKQERALRDGNASVADQPRDTDIESVREQVENPPVTEKAKARRRTAAVADVRVNQEVSTPVDADASRDFQPTIDPQLAAPVAPREARRVLKARREHSKGDGNFPAPEPSRQLLEDERLEDRMPRDVPKSRDDRSAPKGNITAGQDDRNPNIEMADDQRPGPPSRAFSLDAARDAAAMPNPAPRPRPIAEAKRAGSTKGQVKDAMPKPRSRTAATRRPTNKGAAVKRATAKRATAKRAMPKRAMPKRATAKRAGTKRSGTAARKRTTAKRPGMRKR